MRLSSAAHWSPKLSMSGLHLDIVLILTQIEVCLKQGRVQPSGGSSPMFSAYLERAGSGVAG